MFGAVVGLGVWLHRHWIGQHQMELHEEDCLPMGIEWLLMAVHLRLLIAWNFQSFPWLDVVADQALPMIVLPIIGVMCGRVWPFLMSLPIVMIPICGKTLRQLSFQEETTPWELGWDLYVVLPLAVGTLVAGYFALESSRHRHTQSRSWFLPIGLVTATWIYFGLNFAFFHVPWPWLAWTGSDPQWIDFSHLCCLPDAGRHLVPPATHGSKLVAPGPTRGNVCLCSRGMRECDA